MSGYGVRFTETMRGFVSTSVLDDYRSAFERGKADDSPSEFTVTVTVDDVDRLIGDAEHEAELSGTVTPTALSPRPMRVEGGRLNLMVRDADHAGARQMLYSMPLAAADGRRFHLYGFKQVHDDNGPDFWADTTTLYVTVREGHDPSGPVAAKGVVTIAADLARQLTTLKGTGGGPVDRVRGLVKFGRFFAGSLNESYGKVFARPSALNPDAPPREHRQLTCGPSEMHSFTTDDGVDLRLTHFNGGPKGPVILAPGFGNSASSFLLDTTEQNFPEHLFEHGYDIWLLDYRASTALPSGATQFTLDEIATYDYPAAVRTVHELTGAGSVQVMGQCVGSATLLMSLALGLQGVRHAVASQLTLHPRASNLNELRAGLYVPQVLMALGADTLTTDGNENGLVARKALRTGAGRLPIGRRAVRPAVLPAGDVPVWRGVRPRPAQRRDSRGTARGVRRPQLDDLQADRPGTAHGAHCASRRR